LGSLVLGRDLRVAAHVRVRRRDILQVDLEGVQQHGEHREVAQAADQVDQALLAELCQRGGVVTIPLITRHTAEVGNLITTGISSYPVGKGAPPHSHNCDEHVTLLSGAAEVEIDGKVTPLVPHDTTYVKAGMVHCFRNTSGDEPMVILWVYSSA
jgi:mannose-6-phosphate isomerase-like protein (cupin superfamily)